jgi:predicted nucleotidyltransferase
MPNPNLDLLELMADLLRPLLPEIVFVGGCATGLLVTDSGAAPVRVTKDVDVIAEILSYADYAVFSERMHALGFEEDASEGAPLCRWRHGSLMLDVMPLDASILGFSNRWYPEALRTATRIALPQGTVLRVITAPYFLGTKLDAFHDRGGNDYYVSQDLEDVITVIDGRASLIDEVASAPVELRQFISASFQMLLAEPRFLEALPGYLLPDDANQARGPKLMEKLRKLSALPV